MIILHLRNKSQATQVWMNKIIFEFDSILNNILWLSQCFDGGLQSKYSLCRIFNSYKEQSGVHAHITNCTWIALCTHYSMPENARTRAGSLHPSPSRQQSSGWKSTFLLTLHQLVLVRFLSIDHTRRSTFLYYLLSRNRWLVWFSSVITTLVL